MKNNRKKRRLIFITITFVISLMALFFVIVNFRDNIVFFYSPSELQTAEIIKKVQGKQIRIGGLVVQGSIKRKDALNVEFIVTDLEKEIKVNYKGVLPDLFRDEQGVVAKGKFDEQENEFFSSELLVKHDEKYMPPEVAKSLKEQHKK